MAIKPLVDQIADAGSPVGEKISSLGAVRLRDLLDTALAMRMKQTLQLLRSQLVQLGAALKGMALEHRHTVMVARTNSVDASATTWGAACQQLSV